MDGSRTIGLISRSTGRAKLLRDARLRYVVAHADVNERIDVADPQSLVEELALTKARAGKGLVDTDVLVGADSVVVLDHEVIGKPQDHDDAKRMLDQLTGRTHELFSGVAVIRTETGKETSGFRRSLVTLASMSSVEIKNYVDNFQPYHLAGGYEMDGIASGFVVSVSGCPSNIVGMSMPLLRELLAVVGFGWFEFVENAEMPKKRE